MSPQERAERSAATMWANDQASQQLEMSLDKIGPGVAVMSMPVQDCFLNGHNICHGGYIFTLADSAFAFACNSYNQSVVAQHCSVTYLQPTFGGDRLTASATEVSRAGRNGIYDILVTNAQGEAVAQFRGHSRTVKGAHFNEEST